MKDLESHQEHKIHTNCTVRKTTQPQTWRGRFYLASEHQKVFFQVWQVLKTEFEELLHGDVAEVVFGDSILRSRTA